MLLKIIFLGWLMGFGANAAAPATPNLPGDPIKTYIKSIKKHRKSLKKEFKDPVESPIKDEETRKDFKGPEYYPIDPECLVLATVTKTPESEPFELRTSSGKTKTFKKWAVLDFALKGKKMQLSVYQNMALVDDPILHDYLFLPFKDVTNGEETYGGGRYIETHIPLNAKQMSIDFNKCFNPYCAWSTGWNCPIVPKENHLDIRVEAGMKGWLKGQQD